MSAGEKNMDVTFCEAAGAMAVHPKAGDPDPAFALGQDHLKSSLGAR